MRIHRVRQPKALQAIPRVRPNGNVSMLQGAVLVGVLIAWDAGVMLFHPSALLVPSPVGVATSLWSFIWTSPLSTDSVWLNTAYTVVEVGLGFLIGSWAGLLLALLLGRSDRLEHASRPLLTAFQGIPKVAIAPLLIIWLGIGL